MNDTARTVSMLSHLEKYYRTAVARAEKAESDRGRNRAGGSGQ